MARGPVNSNNIIQDSPEYIRALFQLANTGPQPGTSMLLPAAPPVPAPKEASFTGAFKAAAQDTGAGLARIVGADDTANALAAAAVANQPGQEDLGDWLVNTAGSAAFALPTFIAGTLAGSVVGAPQVGFLATSVGMNAASTVEHNYREGLDASVDNWFAQTAVKTGIDYLTMGRVANTLGKMGKGQVVEQAQHEVASAPYGQTLQRIWDSTAARVAKEGGKGFSREALAGAGQMYTDIVGAKMLIGLDPKNLSPEEKRMIAESAAARGMFGGVHGFIDGFIKRHGVDPRYVTDEQLATMADNLETQIMLKQPPLEGELLGSDVFDPNAPRLGRDPNVEFTGGLHPELDRDPMLARIANDAPRALPPPVDPTIPPAGGDGPVAPGGAPAPQFRLLGPDAIDRVTRPADAPADIPQGKPRKYDQPDSFYESIQRQFLGMEPVTFPQVNLLRAYGEKIGKRAESVEFVKDLMQDWSDGARAIQQGLASGPLDIEGIIAKNAKKFDEDIPTLTVEVPKVDPQGKVEFVKKDVKPKPSESVKVEKDIERQRSQDKIDELEDSLKARKGVKDPKAQLRKNSEDTRERTGYAGKKARNKVGGFAGIDKDYFAAFEKMKKKVLVAGNTVYMKGMNRNVVEPAIEMAVQVWNKYMPGHKLVIRLDPTIDANGEYRPMHSKNGDTVHVIALNPESPTYKDYLNSYYALELGKKSGLGDGSKDAVITMMLRDTLFHEIGHAFDRVYLRQLTRGELGRLVAEWQEHLKRWAGEGYEVGEKFHFEGFNALHQGITSKIAKDMLDAKIADGVDMPKSKALLSGDWAYYTSFTEWLANRFKDEMIARGEGRPTLDNKVFGVLKQWWNAISGLYSELLKSYNRSTSFSDILSLIQERNNLARHDGKLMEGVKGWTEKAYKDMQDLRFEDLDSYWHENTAAVYKNFSKAQESKLGDFHVVDGVKRHTTNSKGQPIGRDHFDVEEFWRWFGDSKAVDAQGRPLVFYHGTTADFKQFSEKFHGAGDGHADWGDGFYFTNNPKAANSYAEGEGGNVIPVYLRVKNPADIELMMTDRMQQAAGDGYFETVAEALAEMGKDGIVISHKGHGLEVMVTDPRSIKSVFNNGSFNSNDPVFSRDRAMFDEAFKDNELKGLSNYTDILAKGYNLFHKWTMTPLQMAQKYALPQIKKYMDFVEQWAVYKNKLQEVPEQVVEAWGKLSTDGREAISEFAFKLMEQSKSRTWMEPDPEKPGQMRQASGPKRFSDAELAALAKEHGLTDDQFAIWKQVDDTFQKRLDQMEKAELYGAARPYLDDPVKFMEEFYAAQGRSAQLDVLHKWLGSKAAVDKDGRPFDLARNVLDKKMKEVADNYAKYRSYHYFPQSRFGKYFVKYVAKEDMKYNGRDFKAGDTVLMMTAETKLDYLHMQKEGMKLMADKPVDASISQFSDLEQSIMNMPQSIMLGILENENLDLSFKQRAEIQRMASDLTMDKSFAKHFKMTRSIEGYSRDGLRVYSDYMMKSANHIARMMFGDDMHNSLKELDGAIKNTVNLDTANIRGVYDYFGEHLNYIMRPENDYAAARSFAFHWYLGFNVKAAAVNLTQVPMVALPVLAGRHGYANAAKVMVSSMGDVVKFLRTGEGLSQAEKEMMVRLASDGLIDESIAQNMANYANHNFIERWVPIKDINPKLGTLGRYSGWLFQNGEKLNRRFAGLAAFRMELARTKDAEAAYQYAKSVIRKSQFENAIWNKGNFQRGKLGIVTVFYSYVQNMVNLMTTMDTPEAKKTALTMWGTLLAIGGVQGLPFADWLLDMVDVTGTKFKETFGLKNPRVDSRLFMRQLLEDILPFNQDWVMRGIGRHFFGADISGSIGLGTPLPWLRGASSPDNPDAALGQHFQNFSGAVLGIPIQMYKALNSDNPDTLRNIMMAMPTSVKNLYKGGEVGMNDAVLSPSGGRFYDYDGLGGVAGFFQALGFTSTGLSQKYEQFGAQLESKAYWQAMRHELMNEFYLAKQNRDTARIKEVREKVVRYNQEVRNASLSRLMLDSEALLAGVRNRERVAELRRKGESAQRAYDTLFAEMKKAYPVSGEQ